MTAIPDPPEIRRRWVAPVRHFGLLIGLAAIPLTASSIFQDDHARSSAIHVVISFAALMLIFRLIGKRELSRLSPFELVTLMLVPEVLSNTLQGEHSLVQGLAGVCTLFALVLGFSLAAQRFPRLQVALESPPTVLVADGKLVEQQMNFERIGPQELFSEMRKEGIRSLDEVKWAVLESGGHVTFVKRGKVESSSADEPAERPCAAHRPGALHACSREPLQADSCRG